VARLDRLEERVSVIESRRASLLSEAVGENLSSRIAGAEDELAEHNHRLVQFAAFLFGKPAREMER
jgi:hypothetical protein